MQSATGHSQKPIVSINLTPLVDVSLVLVVIFMATAPMLMQKGMSVYPGEKPGPAKSAGLADDSVILRVSGEGLTVNQRVVAREAEASRLLQAIQESQKKRVVIIPEGEVKHKEIIRVMDLAKQSGAKKLVIMGGLR